MNTARAQSRSKSSRDVEEVVLNVLAVDQADRIGVDEESRPRRKVIPTYESHHGSHDSKRVNIQRARTLEVSARQVLGEPMLEVIDHVRLQRSKMYLQRRWGSLLPRAIICVTLIAILAYLFYTYFGQMFLTKE